MCVLKNAVYIQILHLTSAILGVLNMYLCVQACNNMQTQPDNLESRVSEVLSETATSVTNAVQSSSNELSEVHSMVLWRSKIEARDDKVALANACVASSLTFYAQAAGLTAEADTILQPVSELQLHF